MGREQNYAPRFLCESQYESNSGTPVKEDLGPTTGTPGSSSGTPASTSGTPASSSGSPVKEEHLEPTTGTPGPSSGLPASTSAPVKEDKDSKKIVDQLLLHNVLANL